jgi:hypothetical protein
MAGLRMVATTFQPFVAKSFAVDLPIPEEVPVISTVFFMCLTPPNESYQPPFDSAQGRHNTGAWSCTEKSEICGDARLCERSPDQNSKPTTYLDVITAQTALLTNERLATQLLGQRVVTSVYLVKALGGGWDASQLRGQYVRPQATQALQQQQLR